MGGTKVGNRIAAQPMEGWDGTREGRPTELTFRRWGRFGASGAKLIWGAKRLQCGTTVVPIQTNYSSTKTREMI